MKNKLIKGKKLPISAVMVLYNNEDVLERAIKSFYDLVDEIIIVHDGKCTDKSLEIVKQYTNKIYIKNHTGEAELHRVFTYEKTKNNWILQLDADEYLSNEFRRNLKKLINSNADVFAAKWLSSYNSKKNKYLWMYKSCLFKKDKIYFLGQVHEYVKPVDASVIVKRIEFKLMHEPDYENLSWEVFKRKWAKLAKIQAKGYLKDFRLISKWNYKLKDWDYPTNLRIKYPILYGMIITSIYHLAIGVRNVIKYKSDYYIKLELYTCLYFIMVFYNFKFKRFQAY